MHAHPCLGSAAERLCQPEGHRPANILVDETGQPKILDFGVARMIDHGRQSTRHTGAGQLIGTLTYMSPEQVTADPEGVDARSDVYALLLPAIF